jgi:hypothetical protein
VRVCEHSTEQKARLQSAGVTAKLDRVDQICDMQGSRLSQRCNVLPKGYLSPIRVVACMFLDYVCYGGFKIDTVSSF